MSLLQPIGDSNTSLFFFVCFSSGILTLIIVVHLSYVYTYIIFLFVTLQILPNK